MRAGSRRLLAVAVALACLAAPAWASDPDPALEQAKSAYAEAQKAYALGHFDDALKLYERAFERKPMAAFLFNIGQCYRNLANWDRAAFFYQGYLTREPKAKNRAAVQALIEQMNQKVSEQAAAQRDAAAAAERARVGAAMAATANPPTATEPGASGATTGAVATVSLPMAPIAPVATELATAPPVSPIPPAAQLEPAPTPAPIYKRWWVWTVVGVVVVGAAAGITAAALNPSVSTANLEGSLGPPVNGPR